MFHRSFLNRISLPVALTALLLAGSASWTAQADDQSLYLPVDDGSTVLPGYAPDAVAAPVMPPAPEPAASGIPVVPTAMVAPGQNPFLATAAPAAAPLAAAPGVQAGANPFAATTPSPRAASSPTPKPVRALPAQPAGRSRHGRQRPATPRHRQPRRRPRRPSTSPRCATTLPSATCRASAPKSAASRRSIPAGSRRRDLFVAPTNVDEQPLWDLFAAGRFAEERAQIEAMRADNPTWTPSKELMVKLADAEAAQMLRASYNAGNWQQVVAVAGSYNSLLVCERIEMLWDLGELLARLRNYATAFDVYKYVLINCNDPANRLSTVQKAALLLPIQGTQSLVALGRPLANGTNEFDDVGFAPLRNRLIAVANAEPDALPIDSGTLERFARYARVTRSADDMGLIGWYYLGLEQWDASRAWFATAARLDTNPKFIEGQVLSLRKGGHDKDALTLAARSRARSDGLRQQYIELISEALTDKDSKLKVSGDDMKVFKEAVAEAESPLGAQAIGWSYIADRNLSAAASWFDDFVSWGASEGGVIGQAVIASRLQAVRHALQPQVEVHRRLSRAEQVPRLPPARPPREPQEQPHVAQGGLQAHPARPARRPGLPAAEPLGRQNRSTPGPAAPECRPHRTGRHTGDIRPRSGVAIRATSPC